MTKRAFVLFAFIASITLNGCDPLQGHVGMSDTLDESKSRGVFVSEYEPEANPIRINDSLVFQVNQVWLEKNWKYPKDSKKITIIDGYQLIIKTASKIPRGFDQTWTIGVAFNRHIRTCGERCLMTTFDTLPSGDEESWPIQRGWKLTSDSKKEIIGRIKFRKKR